MAMVGTRFGDEQSTLLDEFERLSFEAHAVQLNRVMLGRSLSEPNLQKSHSQFITVGPVPLLTQVMHKPTRHARASGSGFHKVFKKLLRPILRRKKAGTKQVSNYKDSLSCQTFSRSLRF